MRFTTLDQWLNWQASLHPREIELGLTRCHIVARRLNLLHPQFPIISVAGTNGKGSSVILLDAILAASGYRVGRYTSPHLLRYNERICIAGQEATEVELCYAFELIDQARDEVSLTFFEFATLAAMFLFQKHHVDVAVLEVGLGGRLDAVNIFDCDIALVTAIDIDHVDWLGTDRESIGLEKAGIFRSQRPAVCSDPNPPLSLIQYAQQLHVPLFYPDRDFTYHKESENTWSWRFLNPSTLLSKIDIDFSHLPRPHLLGDFQLQNAAGVLMVLNLLSEQLIFSQTALNQGLINAFLPGRFQVLPGKITRILDVAHNPLGAKVLTRLLHQYPGQGQTHAIIGMLEDKDIAAFLTIMQDSITHWHLAPLNTPRTATVQCLVDKLSDLGVTRIYSYSSITNAYSHLLSHLHHPDRIVICGSFYTVYEVMRLETM